MAKLYFRFGAMNSGKSTSMLQAAYNYEERGQHVLLTKPLIDTKGDRDIVSRLGVRRPVDFLLEPEADVWQEFGIHRERILQDQGGPTACLLVDEAQFLRESQVDDLLRIAILQDVPVIAYGIRTDFQTVAFPGSRRLLEIAHSLEEMKTICRCGRKAVFNARQVGDRFIFDGDQVAIDGADVTYMSLCGACYLAESGGALSSGRPVETGASVFGYPAGPDADFA
ncbi:thymidine kinase [Clavibacter michiganensis]|uniref:thymidine kinase n=1 Tax=Clavibacter michiganensis TaxID=28447 RepID=UPI0005BE2FE8|nr:thymidine kinase [Clavibacter michiganensis]